MVDGLLPSMDTVRERMYEAAFVPELWIPLLDEIAKATGSSEGNLSLYWPEYRSVKTSFEIAPGVRDWVTDPQQVEAWRQYVRTNKLSAAGFFRVDPDCDIFPGVDNREERLKRHKELGYGVQLAVFHELFNGEIVSLEFSRRYGEPQYSDETIADLNRIVPAFRQTALFAARLHLERTKSSIDTLNDLGLPAALIDRSGQVIYDNELFCTAAPYIYKGRGDLLMLKGTDFQRKVFEELLENARREGVSMALPATFDREAAVLNFIPVFQDARSVFEMSGAVVMINPVSSSRGVPTPDLLIGLFGLTPAEAKLATTLASGLSVRDSAAKIGITVGTARSYLNRVFSKTRTEQQSELVSLLKGTILNDRKIGR